MPQPHGARDGVPEIRRFALIIGAMKAGTTSLFEYLSAHPEVAPCTVKEPDFFSDEVKYSEGMDGYRRLWDWDPAKHRVAMEASTNYTKRPGFPGVPSRILKADGEFRFIYIMRDPIDRIESHLSHTAMYRGGVDRVDDEDFRWALDVSRYSMQLDAYLEHWPREAILPLVYETMRDDPAATVDRVVGFLGLTAVPLDPAVFTRIHNTRVDVAAGAVLTRVFRGTGALDRLRRWMPDRFVRWGRHIVGRGRRHDVELRPDQRALAAEALAGDVARLREEWSVDTRAWDPVWSGSEAMGS